MRYFLKNQKHKTKSAEHIARRKARFIFRHGLRENLEKINLLVGEPAYCEDSQELFIGTGDGVTKINIKGEKGDKGETGAKGDIGPEGPAGLNGRDGNPGAIGPQGDRGYTGERGLDGQDGQQGPQGEPGRDGRDGAGVRILGEYMFEDELPRFAETGDGFLVNGDLYVWCNNTFEWTNVGNIMGPVGPQGPRGERGAKGEEGEKGDTGARGLQGEPGIRGDRGPIGLTGEQGPEGRPGRDAEDYIDDTITNVRTLWSSEKVKNYTDTKITDLEASLAKIDDKVNVTNKTWSSHFISVYIKSELTKLANQNIGGDFVNKTLKVIYIDGISRNDYPLTPQTIIRSAGTDNIIQFVIDGNNNSSYMGDIKIIVDNTILYDGDAKSFEQAINIPFLNQIEIYQRAYLSYTSCRLRCAHYFKQ